jgi:hypothetical protein
MQPRCANPECPNVQFVNDVRGHWVQVEEIRLAGELRGQGPVQRLFAAVACSKRCAIAVLTAALSTDDDEEAASAELFSQGQS